MNKPALIELTTACPSCTSTQGKITAGSGPHAAKLECSDCGRWLKWLSKRQLLKCSHGNIATTEAQLTQLSEQICRKSQRFQGGEAA